MLRYFCFILLTLFNLSTYSQSYIGFGADNFNGVHGILTNPANIADSRSLVDINLVSASVFAVNSFYEMEYYNFLVGDSIDFDSQSNKLGNDKTNFGAINADVLGPSVMVSLSEKHSIALSTRARSIININNLDGEVINFFENEEFEELDDILVTDQQPSGVLHNWLEYGGTYARVLKDNKTHFFKGGVTLKYIRGFGAANFSSKDALLYFNRSADEDTVVLQGEAGYSASTHFNTDGNNIPFEEGDDYELETDTWGFGMDLGLVYEYRPNHRQNISKSNVREQVVIRHKSTYKYKIGLSIMDIGAVNYKEAFITSATLDNIDRSTLLDGGDFENEIKPAFGALDSRDDLKILLPTTIRADFDLKLKDKFYFNATSRLSLISKNNAEATRYANQVTISPRFETKWATVFSPITYTQFGGMQWGLGGRLGPIFLGSSGAISHLIIDKQTRAFDLYAGIKIPIFHKTPPPPPEDDPANGFKSNCKDCIEKEKKQPKKRLKHYNGLVK